jgi:hypothetical protein
MRGKKNYNLLPNSTYESNENDIDDEDLSKLLNILRTKQNFYSLLHKSQINEPTKLHNTLFDRDHQLSHLPPESQYHTTNDLNYNIIDDYDKRGATDFRDMLNKKSLENMDFFSDKRAPVGFQGVRGKKDVNNVLRNLAAEKRSSAGFFGMRGKKEPTVSKII